MINVQPPNCHVKKKNRTLAAEKSVYLHQEQAAHTFPHYFYFFLQKWDFYLRIYFRVVLLSLPSSHFCTVAEPVDTPTSLHQPFEIADLFKSRLLFITLVVAKNWPQYHRHTQDVERGLVAPMSSQISRYNAHTRAHLLHLHRRDRFFQSGVFGFFGFFCHLVTHPCNAHLKSRHVQTEAAALLPLYSLISSTFEGTHVKHSIVRRWESKIKRLQVGGRQRRGNWIMPLVREMNYPSFQLVPKFVFI